MGKIDFSVKDRWVLLAMTGVYVLVVGSIFYGIRRTQSLESIPLEMELADRGQVLVERLVLQSLFSSFSDQERDNTRELMRNTARGLLNGGSVYLDLNFEQRKEIQPIKEEAARSSLMAYLDSLDQLFLVSDRCVLALGTPSQDRAQRNLVEVSEISLKYAQNTSKQLEGAAQGYFQKDLYLFWMALLLVLFAFPAMLGLLIRAQREQKKHKRMVEQGQDGVRAEIARHRAVLDSALDGVVTLDRFGAILSFNKAAETIFLCQASEVIGESVSILLSPDHKGKKEIRLLRFLEKGMGNPDSFFLDFIGIRENEQVFPLEMGLLRSEVNSAILYTGVLRDISKRIEDQNFMEELKKRSQVVLDTSAEGIINIDESGFIQSVNASAEKLFGYSTEQLVGQNIKMLMPEPHRKNHNSYLADYLRTGKAKMIGVEGGREVFGLRSNGERFAMKLSVGAVKVGEDIFFTGFVRDLSLHKETEAALKDSLASHHCLLETIRDGILTIDKSGVIHCANSNLEKLTGYRAGEIEGQSLGILLSSPDREQLDDYLSRFQKVTQGSLNQMSWEVTGVRNDHSEYPLELSLGLLKIKGKPLFTVILKDLTQHKLAEKALADQAFRLEKASRFDRCEGHIMSLFQRGNSLRQASKEMLELLASDLDFFPSSLHLYEDLDEKLKLSVAQGLPPRFQQDFQLGEGLIGQAASDRKSSYIKSAEKSEQFLKIETGWGVLSGQSMLILPVICQDQLLGVLTLGFQSVSEVEHKIFGERLARQIGMVIRNQNLTEQIETMSSSLHEGSQVDSVNEVDHDTDSQVSFLGGDGEVKGSSRPFISIIGSNEALKEGVFGGSPQEMAKQANEIISNSQHFFTLVSQKGVSESADPVQTPLCRGKILNLDQERPAGEGFKDFLENWGYSVLEFRSSKQVLNELEKTTPDLISLDLNMPRMEGMKLLEAISTHRVASSLPVLVLSPNLKGGYSSFLGFDAILRKPIPAHCFINVINRIGLCTKPRGKEKILVAENDPETLSMISTLLSGEVFEVETVQGESETLERIGTNVPDALIMNAITPEFDGFSVIEKLSHERKTRSLPIILLMERLLTKKDRKLMLKNLQKAMKRGENNRADLKSRIECLLRIQDKT